MYKKSSSSFVKHLDFMIIDLLLLAGAYVLAFLVRHQWAIPRHLSNPFIQFGIILLIVYLLIGLISNAYKDVLHRNKWLELIQTVFQVALTLVILLLYLFITKQSAVLSRWVFVLTAAFAIILIWPIRVLWKHSIRMRLLRNNIGGREQMLLILEASSLDSSIQEIFNKKYQTYDFCGIVTTDPAYVGEDIEGIPIVAGINDLEEYVLANIVDDVLISIDNVEMSALLINYFLEMGIVVHMAIMNSDSPLPNARLDEIGDMFVLTTSLSAASPWQLMVKRIADIIGGLIGCLITGIAYLFVAPQIKKIDPGPVFFHQTRIGKNGRRFELYKFRSMYQDAEARKAELMDLNEMEGPMFKIKNDPRILPKIGKRIRDWSVDELPQFWNILKGDMSLVGTRPPTVEEFECYEPHHKARLAFKPGLTGLWQVSGRNRIDEFEEIVRLDTEYIKNWSLKEDLIIILKTFVVVFKRKGSM
ncbi:MAG: sugar transferase [Aeriscardovia sp.]|nr:sugar transferase [Aeriscardovia sp.]MBR2755975.1 sugar transferase [Lachnospiraceae bacterium]